MHTRLKYLLDLHLRNAGSEQEKAEFEELINNSANEAELFRLLEEEWKLKDLSPKEISEARSNEILKNIFQSAEAGADSRAKTIRMVPRWQISVAIILILLCVTGAYLYFSPQKKAAGEFIANNKTSSGDFLPGTHSATLEMSDGRKVTIDSTTTGQVAEEGSVGLNISSMTLVYSASTTGENSVGKERFNTVRTGNAQQYAVRFTDGTQIWLNPGSSVRYKVPFDGDIRAVAITGEVEFEVTKQTGSSFSASVISDKKGRNLTVNVLGTHFKINAYPDEPKVKTTLVEGSVELVSGTKTVRMKPGQQGSLDSAGDFQLVNLPDAGKQVDLKSDLFYFKDDDIKSVLREIARWYDVELVYQDDIIETKFSGAMQKSLTLKAVIKKLDKYVQLKLEDRKLIVTQ